MKTNYHLVAAAVLGISMLGGCYTTVVDKGPPKIGQTTERPNPAEEVAQTHANQVQQDTSTPNTVVPGNNPEPVPASGNSIFDNGVVTNPSTAGANMPAGSPDAVTNGSVSVGTGPGIVTPPPKGENLQPANPTATPTEPVR